MQIQKTYLGYWYQRTTLHLSEIYDFLAAGESPLRLDSGKLAELRRDLGLEKVKLTLGVLEVIEVEAHDGIQVKIYEDGLVVLSNDHTSIESDVEELTSYFEQKFLPAIGYIFSLGAPVPKELANIHTIYPCFIVTKNATSEGVAKLLSDLGEKEYFGTTSGAVELYRGDRFYVVNSKLKPEQTEDVIAMLIFFREFKGQLHHYLNLHREIWEKIDQIKEQRQIRGKLVGTQRATLESYKKTVELIEGRIEQMDVYIETRSAMVKKDKLDSTLSDILEFKYDNLSNSIRYIKSLWSMTKQYLDSAINVFSEINALSTRNSVQALTVISSIGVISGVIGFLSTDTLPSVTRAGLVYFGLLLVGSVIVNRLLQFIYSHIKYKINDVKLTKFSGAKEK